MTDKLPKLAMWMVLIGAAMLMFGANPAVAAEEGAAASKGEQHVFLTTDGARKLGGAIGAGLMVIGGAAGIGRIGSSAVEATARQPEVAGDILKGMIISAAMIEGALLFALVVGLIAVL